MQLYNAEGQPMETWPDGLPIPPGRYATPQGVRETPAFNVPASVQQQIQALQAQAQTAAGQGGATVAPMLDGGTAPDVFQADNSRWWRGPAVEMQQLYNLQGQPMEQVPMGAPLPAGRWTTPTGGVESGNGGWGTPATTVNGTAFPAVPATPQYQQMTAINNLVGGLNGTNAVTTPAQLQSWLAANPGATFDGGTVTRQPTAGPGFDPGAAINSLSGYDSRILANEGAQTLAAQLALAPGMLNAYQQFAPQYAKTDLDMLRQTMFGNIDVNKFFGIGEDGVPTKHTEFYEGYINAGGLNGGQEWLNKNVLNSSYINPADLLESSSGGTFALNNALTQAANQQTVSANSAFRQGNVNDAAAMGPQALAAMKSLNPNLYNSLDAAQQSATGGIGISPYQQTLGAQFNAGPQYDRIAAPSIGTSQLTAPQMSGIPTVGGVSIGTNAVQAPQMAGPGGISAQQLGAPSTIVAPNVNASDIFAPQMGGPQQVNAWMNPLLQSASQQAGGAGLSALGGDLERMAREELAQGRNVSEDALRRATQAERESWAARGLVMSPGAVASEILSRDDIANQRLRERQAFAASVNQLGQGQQGINNQYMLGVLGAGATQGAQSLQAQMANQGAGIDVGARNQQAALQALLANQGAGLAASQANQQGSLQAQLANQGAGIDVGARNQAAALQAAQSNQQSQQATGQSNLGAALQAALSNQQNAYQSQFATGQFGQQAQIANQGAALTGGQANLGASLQTGLANQQNAYQSQIAGAEFGQQAALANQQARLNAQQQNMGLGTSLAGLDYSRQQQNFGNTLANAQMQAANRFDPFSTITSAGSANQGTNPALFGMGGTASSGGLSNQSVQNQFNPFNAYSSDLFNTNYNAMVGAKMNAENVSAGKSAAWMRLAGTVLGGVLGGPIGAAAGSAIGGAAGGGGQVRCWVAREVYTPQNPRWLVFREWLDTRAPAWFHDLYMAHGEAFAEFIKDKPDLKDAIRGWMDERVAEMESTKLKEAA